MTRGYLVLEAGAIFPGFWHGGANRAGEVVFNTSHSGYEEMATDPSYYSQILVTTAPMQGNYGEFDEHWESGNLWIDGFICLEIQNSARDQSWLRKLLGRGIPVLSQVDTRRLVMHLRRDGTPWGALVQADNENQARELAYDLIKKKKMSDLDWAFQVSRKTFQLLKGHKPNGPRVAVLDFGCKENTLRELKKRCSEVGVFPSRSSAQDIRQFKPDGIMLSNGPGDPADVQVAVSTIRELLGWRFMFGICMGHQILGLALGAKTYKLKFGHRGSNHPIQDRLLNKIYMTSQNHGYAVDEKTLPSGVEVTHVNLNDQTVAGIHDRQRKVLSVQFHPESHPGPHDADILFDFFMRQIT